MKKTTRTLPLAFSALLLIFLASVSASAQGGYFVEGQIRWRKAMGVVPAGPGNERPASSPCNIFSVVAIDNNAQKVVTATDQVSAPFRSTDEENFYVCRYSLKVPEDRNLYMVATMGGILGLPKKDDDSPYLLTDAWLNGSEAKPRNGSIRGFTGQKFVNLRSRVTTKKVVWVVNFEMVYVRNDPN